MTERLEKVFFPDPPNGSGAAAVMKAADDAAAVAEWKRQVIDALGLCLDAGADYAIAVIEHLKAEADATGEARCRVQELEAENAELRERIEEHAWEHKDDRPAITGKAADDG